MSHHVDEVAEFQAIQSDPKWVEQELDISQLVVAADVCAAFRRCYIQVNGEGNADSPPGTERLLRDVRVYFRERVIPDYVARYLQCQQRNKHNVA